MPDTPKKLFIKTWGCQMNVYDSRRMADVLLPLGYAAVETPKDADMVILNTCHIREKATDKVFSELGRLRAHKKRKAAKGGRMIVAVAGCVAQAEGEFIMKREDSVDLVFGPQAYHELPEMVMKATGERIVNTDFPAISKFDKLPEETADHGPCAFLSVQEGCDKFCTFCVVPYTRGSEYSRDVKGILDEAQRLRDSGAREITLLGQNVNAFHGEGPDSKVWGLGRLIEAVAEIDGIERIRYTTSHPRDMDDELIAAHRDVAKLMPFLHLPVQSGSDAILKAMNRKHEASLYYKVIDRLRAARPDLALSSDFIVGFPGETEEDFQQTLKLASDIGYASAYTFKYSARPGTPAATMKGLVHEKVKEERLTRLNDLIMSQQKAFNEKCLGRTLPVLFDRRMPEKGQLHGRSPYNQAVHVPLPAAPFAQAAERLYGQIMDIKITGAFANSLTGEIVVNESIFASPVVKSA